LLTFQVKKRSVFTYFSNQPISCCHRIFATWATGLPLASEPAKWKSVLSCHKLAFKGERFPSLTDWQHNKKSPSQARG
jgi:hypothetical protein